MDHRPLLLAILAGVGGPGCLLPEQVDGTACLDVPDDATECPAAEDVDKDELFVPMDCDGLTVHAISGEGSLVDLNSMRDVFDTGGAPDAGCCYTAELIDHSPRVDCIVGRPYREDQKAVLAPAVIRNDWGSEDVEPEVADSDRAQAWSAAALGEHASVAAFAKLALELMAHGAPPDLLHDVFAAGGDEVDHAERCWAMAARFGPPLGPGAFPFPGPTVATRRLADIAADAVREGCVGETVGAQLARAAAGLAPDPEIAAAFAAIARDEERHAVLSWRIVAWAVRVGGADVRAAVAAAFREPAPTFDIEEIALRAGVSPVELTHVVPGAVREVLRPAAAALLAA